MQQFNQTTAVGGVLTTILELERLDARQINADISNGGPQALVAMEVAIKLHPSAQYKVIASAAGDFAAPVGFLWSSDSGFATLASGATGWMVLDNLESVYAVRIRAQSAGASLINVAGQMGPN